MPDFSFRFMKFTFKIIDFIYPCVHNKVNTFALRRNDYGTLRLQFRTFTLQTANLIGPEVMPVIDDDHQAGHH